MQKGKQLVAMAPEGQDSNTEQDLRNLEEKWESVQAKVAERKVRSGQWTPVAPKGKSSYFPHTVESQDGRNVWTICDF